MSPSPPSILKATLHVADGIDVRLVHYPAGLSQPRHRHELAQLSILLAGSLREITHRRDVEALRSASGVKPCGQSHAAEFGPQGALMLSMTLAKDPALQRRAGEWIPTSLAIDDLIAGLLATDDMADRAEMAEDLKVLLAISGGTQTGQGGRAGGDVAWRLKQALDDSPDGGRIGVMADDLGLHRAHLTRCFTQAFGLAPSRYRARIMTARALTLALRGGDGLAAVAVDAGFADQSHLARTCRQQIGISPSRIRTLFGDATSVQAMAG